MGSGNWHSTAHTRGATSKSRVAACVNIGLQKQSPFESAQRQKQNYAIPAGSVIEYVRRNHVTAEGAFCHGEEHFVIHCLE